MAEQHLDLEARLRALAATAVHPATPALRARVVAAISAAPAPATRGGFWQRSRLRLAAAGTLVVAVLVGTVPPLRTAVAGWVGLRGVVIEQPHVIPTPAPTVLPSGTPALGSGLDLGQPTSLAAARPRLAFTPLLPSALPAADGVFLREPPTGGALSLAYRAGPGRPPPIGGSGVSILVTEFRGDLAPEFFGKFVGQDATVTQMSVGGDAGYWIAGAPHAIGYHEHSGDFNADDLRLATNTLVWQHGNLLLRVEGMQTQEQATAIALSMR